MTSLDTLALRIGIEQEFRDAQGEVHETSPETKRGLLAAMGIRAESEEKARRVLSLLDEAEWKRSVPPVRVVCPTEDGILVEVVVPSDASEVTWSVELEDGGRLEGSASVDGSTLVETHGVRQRHRVVIARGIPHGYHLLRTGVDDSVCSLIVTPGKCWLPEAAESGDRLWGVAVQLYLLRSATNWGIGDFTDLRRMVELVDGLGGDVLGVNPLHSLFLDDPEQASPYSPQDRLLLNVLNIDVEAIPEFGRSSEAQELVASEVFQARVAKCRAAKLVDYAGVAELKMQALRLLFEAFGSAENVARQREFEEFRESAGASFRQSCLFAALRQHFAAMSGKLADWHSWPAEYRDPGSEAVAKFAEDHSETVAFHGWLQWVADQQLGAAAAAAKDMQVGLYRDLAVGTDPTGAATWSSPEAVVSGAHAGAPPDMFNPAGQDWGLPPFCPRMLYQTGYRNFIDLVRANMRHAGGLRIDHAMALQHLYWVPAGRSPREGAYVKYRMDDLIGILALESHRNRCLIVGEDLGTVPEGFRERMMSANILSYRVLCFEQDSVSGEFVPPADYPRLAVGVAGSHDLPTIRGWWQGVDIEIKERLHLFPKPEQAGEARATRERDRDELLRALRSEGVLPEGEPVQVEVLTAAVHAYLARTESLLTMAQIDDITAETEPVNVPATSDENPNWRRRLSLTIEELAEHPRMRTLARVLDKHGDPATVSADAS